MEYNCKYCCKNFYYVIIDIKDKIMDFIFELNDNNNYKYQKVKTESNSKEEEYSSDSIVEWDLV